MIKIGNLDITTIYIGSTNCSAAYVGEYKIYGDEPQPSIPNNEIWYTTTDGLTAQTTNTTGITSLNTMGLVSNKVVGDKCVMTFSKDVTSIGNNAFNNCSSLTNITIPNSVTSIGNSAFSYCTSLTSITIPFRVTSIGVAVFYNCSSLTSIEIPNSVTSIGINAFASCTSLESVILPNSVTSISNSAFSNCANLSSIEIPNSVTRIDDNAFSYCSSLKNITIPNSVTSIGNWAFFDCRSLTGVTYLGTMDEFKSITKGSDWKQNTPLQYINCTDGIIDLEASKVDCLEIVNEMGETTVLKYEDGVVDDIDYMLQMQAVSLTFLPDCKELNGLLNFRRLSTITITNDTEISNFDSMSFQELLGWESGEGKTFYCNPNYPQYEEFKQIAEERGWTVKTWPQITPSVTLTFTDGTTRVDEFADGIIPNAKYKIATRNIQSVEIGDGITTIGDEAFSSQINITSITIPNSVTTIGNWCFADCPISSIVLPSGITEIAHHTFYRCSNLTNITLPNSVTTIGEHAFWGCSGLKTISMNFITSIGRNAFYECSSLMRVVFGPNVTSIDSGAFYGCTSLTNIASSIDPLNIPTVDMFTFYNVPEGGTLQNPRSGDYSQWLTYLKNWTVQ